ncbi:MAG: chromate transporter [Oscillospiraceae bacterium]|nr:chromate transporter [Oscillospiraceae bacterium]MBR6608103.1 chromate transporter [Oscillospiraceae bacterium]
MIYLRLFYEFFKAGLFAVGGGLATLPFLQDISDSTGWFTHGQLADMVAVSESTPGPIGVNMATYVGFTAAGVPGAVIATLGLITPSIIVILIIAGFLKAFRDNKYVQGAFYGLRPASTGLITAAGMSVVFTALIRPDLYAASGSLLALFDLKAILLAVILYGLTHWKKLKKIHPAAWIGLSAVVGILFRFAGK